MAKKCIAILLSLMCLCTLFVGCANAEEPAAQPSIEMDDAENVAEKVTLPVLAPEKEREIVKEFLSVCNLEEISADTVSVTFFLGEYNGAYVFYLKGYYDVNGTVDIGGASDVTIKFGETPLTFAKRYAPLVYKDKTFCTLRKAYENGDITDEDIADIKNNLSAVSVKKYSAVDTVLDEKTNERICQSYLVYYMTLHVDADKSLYARNMENIEIYHELGRYGDGYAVMLYNYPEVGAHPYPPAIPWYSITFEGVELIFNLGDVYYLHGEALYTLFSACNNGFITKEDLKDISAQLEEQLDFYRQLQVKK